MTDLNRPLRNLCQFVASLPQIPSKRNAGQHTEYVSTRWYRAPEIALRMTHYTEKVDVFALGCIMGEMLLGRPVFPGTSEADQLTRIVTVLGAPSR